MSAIETTLKHKLIALRCSSQSSGHDVKTGDQNKGTVCLPGDTSQRPVVNLVDTASCVSASFDTKTS